MLTASLAGRMGSFRPAFTVDAEMVGFWPFWGGNSANSKCSPTSCHWINFRRDIVTSVFDFDGNPQTKHCLLTKTGTELKCMPKFVRGHADCVDYEELLSLRPDLASLNRKRTSRLLHKRTEIEDWNQRLKWSTV